MFAPPPVHLSKAQIEGLRAASEARKATAEEAKKEKRKSGESSYSLTKAESISSLQKPDSQSPKRKVGLFARGNKFKVSSPIAQDVERNEQAVKSRSRQDSEDARESKNLDISAVSPPPFAKQPRRAPMPPPKADRAATKMNMPPPIAPPPVGKPPAPPAPSPPPAGPPPPVPHEPNVRQGSATLRGHKNMVGDSIDGTLLQAAEEHKVHGHQDSRSSDEKIRPPRPARASTDPVAPSAGQTFKQPPVKAKRTTIGGKPEGDKIGFAPFQANAVSKTPKRTSAAASIRAALLDIDSLAPRPRGRSPSPLRKKDVDESADGATSASSEAQLPWKRRRKGETISMLLDAGFFPEKRLTTDKLDTSKILHVDLPPRLAPIDKELPDTPDSILPTPTELYQTTARRPLPVTQRNKVAKRRSPLAHLSKTSARANSVDNNISPSRLSAIPELAGTRDSSDSTPLSSGTTTPVATKIHLRNGSIVTVQPPESTAWERHSYIQGPIKLPKPIILPRNNSIASLDAFQEAIEQVYQEALTIPRRRSDDAVEEGICEWFDDFGFESVEFAGDILVVEDLALDDIHELGETHHDADNTSADHFVMAPQEQGASPIEKVVAKEVLELAKPAAIPEAPIIPPVETEGTLRAKGIARLSQQARKESMTLAKSETVYGITAPAPEQSMLSKAAMSAVDDVPEEDEGDGVGWMVDQSGWSDSDPDELDEQPAWIAPAIQNNQGMLNRGLSKKETRNPVRKMRRLMATASAIL
ncbi:hypothetical protein D0869_03935 [Hortaea werneckii]|uniref:Uncharacterized protein n=1 Tax=Hortaea werneckii TaxID=91943 RepID=A0A3M6X337_HORWE|nr:hypothetical protein KC316_g11226 [Hortaea werneckii]RMX85293.1 hypothetical protein D0869_03935 [Hortaea werneckii]